MASVCPARDFDTQFKFLNPGIGITQNGAEIELSAGMNGSGFPAGLFLFGGLLRYGPGNGTTDAGLELGATILLAEIGISNSGNQGSGVFFAPNLCIPLPLVDPYVTILNLFYRVYGFPGGSNAFGASLKFAFPLEMSDR